MFSLDASVMLSFVSHCFSAGLMTVTSQSCSNLRALSKPEPKYETIMYVYLSQSIYYRGNISCLNAQLVLTVCTLFSCRARPCTQKGSVSLEKMDTP